MNAAQFNTIVENRLAHCRATLTTKGDEYSRGGDRLWNFKRAAMKQGLTPAEALLGMKAKHDVSIDDIVDRLHCGAVPAEMVAEKITDSINYLLLLEGVIEEQRCGQVVGDSDPWQEVSE